MVVMCIAVGGSQTPLTALSCSSYFRVASADRHATGSQLTEY